MKAVILCGGLGTRAYPFTRHVPKALMAVGGVPMVEQVMRIYAANGIDEFVLAVGYLKEDIIQYFRHRGSWKVQCVDTGEGTDTGGRVRLCLDHAGPRFHATYCDGLGDIDLHALARFHEEHSDGATVTAAPLRSQYGVLRTDPEDRIVEFVEKPVLPEHWINAGFFMFDRDAYASVPGENLERDVLPRMAERRMVRVHRHCGFWRSMDTHKDQQEMEVLWAPYVEQLAPRLPHAADPEIPDWLRQKYQLAALGAT